MFRYTEASVLGTSAKWREFESACRHPNKNQTPHNLYYVKCVMCMNGRLQIEQEARLSLGAIYDALQIAADASSAAFTARAAVRAPVAS